MSIFTKIGQWIHDLFSKSSKLLETVILPAAIAITNGVKAILDVDKDDIIGHLAGTAGADLEDKLKGLLPGIILKLQLAKAFEGQNLTPEQVIAGILKIVGSSQAITQTAFYIEFSGLVADALGDGKLDLGESVTLIKYWYENHPVAKDVVTGTLPEDPAPEDDTNS